MKVFRLNNDVNRYQYFLTENESDAMKLISNCAPSKATWLPPPVFVYKPRHQEGDFYNFYSGTPILTPRATELLRDYLEMSGELLPLPYKSEIFTLLNITECINCLDEQNSEWLHESYPGEKSGPIKKYVFHPDRFSESDIFKIPETSPVEVLVLDREEGEGCIDILRNSDITGYELTLLWED